MMKQRHKKFNSFFGCREKTGKARKQTWILWLKDGMGILVWLPFKDDPTSTKNKTNYSHDKKNIQQAALNYDVASCFLLVWRQQEYKKTKQDQWQEDEKSMECQQKNEQVTFQVLQAN